MFLSSYTGASFSYSLPCVYTPAKLSVSMHSHMTWALPALSPQTLLHRCRHVRTATADTPDDLPSRPGIFFTPFSPPYAVLLDSMCFSLYHSSFFFLLLWKKQSETSESFVFVGHRWFRAPAECLWHPSPLWSLGATEETDKLQSPHCCW